MFSFAGTGGSGRPKAATFFVYFLMPTENGLSIDARTAEITNLLKAWGSGDEAALAQLTEHVYPELRLMARRYMKNEAQGNTLQATALVHEVYLRLVDVTNVEWQARAQFFAIAAQMMRRILVDAARTRGSRRRGGIPLKVNLDESAVLSPAPDRSILALDEALTAFSQVAPRQAKVVELRYFGGLTEEEIVAALKISPRTARRDWDLAKAWLLRELSHTIGKPSGPIDMTPERFRQIEELYHAAREGTAEERAALLAQADPELRREVESLLAQPRGGEFLDRPAIGNASRTAGGFDSHRIGFGRVPGTIPYRKQARRGRHGRSLSRHRHAIRPRRRHQDHSRAVQRPFRARGARDFVAESSEHLHASRRRAQLPGDGTGGGRDAGGAAEKRTAPPEDGAPLCRARSRRRWRRRTPRASFIAISSPATS